MSIEEQYRNYGVVHNENECGLCKSIENSTFEPRKGILQRFKRVERGFVSLFNINRYKRSNFGSTFRR